MDRLARLLLLIGLALLPNQAFPQGPRTQPRQAITLVGPDGPAAAALSEAWLAPWAARQGRSTYVAAASAIQAVRLVAARRESAPVDLLLVDAHAADYALARGLVLPVAPEAAAPREVMSPLALAVGGPCVPVAFDVLAIRSQAASSSAALATAGLAAIAAAPLADRQALPAPDDLLGALLVGLLAQGETGEWRSVGAGLARLQWLRGPQPAPEAGPPPGLQVVWNGAAQREADAAPGSARIAIPEEASMLRPLVLCLSASARQPRAAMAFMGYALGGAAQAALARALYVAPVHAGIDLAAPLRARIPSLAPAARPVLVDGAFRNDLRAALARRPARLAMGTGPGNTPRPD